MRRVKPLKNNYVVYRGVKFNSTKYKSIENLKEGQEFIWDSPTSTSANSISSLNFSGGDKDGNESIFYQINVPKGTNAIVTNEREAEVLLQPGTKFRVSNIKNGGYDEQDNKIISKILVRCCK